MRKAVNAFCDLDINFDRNPMSNDVALRREEEAIKRSLRNLIFLKRHEKPFHPEINSGVTDMLFELVDPVAVLELRSRISEMIRNYEPRVQNAIVDITDNIDRNEVRIVINFTIRNVQKVYNLSVVLERIR